MWSIKPLVFTFLKLAIKSDLGTLKRMSMHVGRTYIMIEEHVAPQFYKTKELTVPKGSLVKVIKVSEFGWWTVSYSGARGIVPRQKMRVHLS